MPIQRGDTDLIASNVEEFEIRDVGDNRFVIAFRDSQNRLNLAAGHASSNGAIHLDTQITPFEIAPGKIFRIKRLCSILRLSNPHFITFVVAVIDQEHGIDHAFTFQVKGDTITRQSFVNEIAPTGGLPISQHNAHFTPYISSRLLYSTFPAHSSHKSGVSLHEVEFFDGQTSFITHDGKEFPGGSGNPLNVSSSLLSTGAIIHVGGRLFHVRVNGTRLEILDNISEPNVDFNERSSAVIPTTNMGNIFSLLTEKVLISYKIDDGAHIIKLWSHSFQNSAVSADEFQGDHIITATGGNLRLALWRVYRAGVFIKVEETPGQESGIEQVRITNLRNPLYLVGIKNRDGELRLITWGVTITPSPPLPHSGVAWPQLESKVDALVKDFFLDRPVVGMTVAVSIGRRVILSKGYGWARFPERPMERDMHVLIGSVTKALITGPAGCQLMDSKGIKPESQTLYGPMGLFGNNFDEDIKMGIENFANDDNFDSSKWMEWYRKITIQNLLDHRSGFSGGGDEPGARRMFPEADPFTYEHIHKHFLRTRPLLDEPGKTYSYSNHGFGLWTFLVPRMSNKSYSQYIENDYLGLISPGLHNSIHAKSETPDSRDAVGYRIDSRGNLLSNPFENSTVGLASGGFMASAQNMIRVMRFLKRKYENASTPGEELAEWEDINKMGWEVTTNKRWLYKGGDTSGGTGWAVMYPKGGSTVSGSDLSDICVAINTNINSGVGSTNLGELANNIAPEVDKSNVPANLNLLPELGLG
jgi:CubicO group peptidase (beta-lactamase class C family)